MGRQVALVAWAVLALLSLWGLPVCRGFATPTPQGPLEPPMWPQSQELRRQEETIEARRLGEQFVKAILTQPIETLASAEEESEECTVKVWRNIPCLYSKRTENIVLRSIDEPFWQSCIDRVEFVNPLSRYRVCAVGTSGTGTTCTTPLLLRMLLLKGSTVVYLRRTNERCRCFHEFVPRQSFNNEHDGEIAVTVNVYPEESKWYDIPSLEDTSTYYVVDPGRRRESCNPDEAFPARVIIVSSADDSRHWGGDEFLQRRSGQAGTFRYYPLWKWTEVVRGWDYFPRGGRLSSQLLPERYRQLGGVPHNLEAHKGYYKQVVARQVYVAKKSKPAEALRIVSGKMDIFGDLKCGYSKSYVIGIDVADDDLGTFAKRKAVPISMTVAETVFSVHIHTLWDDMVQKEQHLIFESYLRTALSTVDGEITVPLLEQGTRTSKRLTDQPPSKIGGYSSIQMVPAGESIVKAAVENLTANILFYSPDPRNPHIDFVCKDNDGNILAFKATTSPTQSVDLANIRTLEDEVGDRGLMLYFVHPARSEKFTSKPVNPTTRFCWIFHVEIPKPMPREPDPW